MSSRYTIFDIRYTKNLRPCTRKFLWRFVERCVTTRAMDMTSHESTLVLDHIAIAVQDFDAAVARYTLIHNAPPTHITHVASEGVRVAFFAAGAPHVELIAPLTDQSPITKFLAKRGEGLHHLCYRTTTFDATCARLRTQGLALIDRKTTVGAAGARIAFFHPKETHGVLLEIVEAAPEHSSLSD